MYSYEERKKAVELYIQYGYRAAAVIRELGYPDRHTLKGSTKKIETCTRDIVVQENIVRNKKKPR